MIAAQFTKITKIFDHENLELYGIFTCNVCCFLLASLLPRVLLFSCMHEYISIIMLNKTDQQRKAVAPKEYDNWNSR